jgi:hypothetical protein
LKLVDSIFDFLSISIIEVPFELWKVLIQIFFADFANCNCLFEKIVFDNFFTSIVQSIGLFVHGMFVISLVENSFSHIFVLLHSSHFFNVFNNDFKQIFVSLLLNMRFLWVFIFFKFIFLFEKLVDIFTSQLFDLFVDLTLNLFRITILVG